jgi:DNA-binding NtrC family response regulator
MSSPLPDLLAAFAFTPTGSIDVDEGVVYGRRAAGEERHFIARAPREDVATLAALDFATTRAPRLDVRINPDAIARRDAAQAAAHAAERDAMLAALEASHGNERAAAAALGINPSTLQRKLAAEGYDAAWRKAKWPLSGRQPRG